MPKAPKAAYYAVAKGRQAGIYTSWPDCEHQVKGFVGAVHKKFPTRDQAQAFLDAAKKGRSANESYQAAAKVAKEATLKSFPTSEKSRGKSAGRVAKQKESDGSASDQKPLDDTTSQTLRSLASRGFSIEHNRLIVWTDGASKDNGKRIARAGVGVFWGKQGDASGLNVAERLPDLPQTNNRAELLAIIRALETCPTSDVPLEIRTDSQYSISCLTVYLPNWLRNDFRTQNGGDVKNKDLLVHLMTLLDRRGPNNRVKFTYVKAHVGIEGNEAADQLACDGAAIEPIPTRRDWLTLDDLAQPRDDHLKQIKVQAPSSSSASEADSGVERAECGKQPDVEIEVRNVMRRWEAAIADAINALLAPKVDPAWLLSEDELAKLDETQDF